MEQNEEITMVISTSGISMSKNWHLSCELVSLDLPVEFIFDRDLLRNRGPTSDFVGIFTLVCHLTARWRYLYSLLSIVVIFQHCINC